MTRAVLGLGSNLGDRVGHLRAAVRGLGQAVRAVSGVYESPPWDPDRRSGAQQWNYLNAVVLVADAVDAWGWLECARLLEAAAGRVRDPGWRYGPRTLDVLII